MNTQQLEPREQQPADSEKWTRAPATARAAAPPDDGGLEHLKALSPGGVALSLGGLLAGIAIGICLMANPRDASTSAKREHQAATDHSVVKVEAGQMDRIKLEPVALQAFQGEKVTTGRIAFNDNTSTLIFFPFTGRITKLFTEPGETVKKGDLMIELDSPDVVQPQADLISAISGLKNSQTALRLAQKNEEISKREIESTQRNLELAKINEQRQKELYGDKAASLLTWETAEQAAKAAEQTLETAKKDFEQSQNDVATAKANNESNEMILNAARNKLHGVFGKTDEQISAIEKTHLIDRSMRVFAPIVGRITQRKCYAGEFITQSITDPLFTIADLSTVWMLADVYETDDAIIKLGLPIEVTVMAYPKDTFKAKISYISPSVDPNTHRVSVRCVVDNPGQKLKSDMFASFKILTADSPQTPAVPETAVLREGEKRVVWVQRSENEFNRRDVVTGLEQNGRIQILSGLQPGEKIVSEGAILLENVGATAAD